LDDVTQARWWEVKGMDQKFIACGHFHEPTSAGQGLLRREVNSGIPIGMF
jgi:hypothetical protein